MSKITANYKEDEIIIKKERKRVTDKNIERINLVNLSYNKEYKSKIVMSNSEQENQIILVTTIPDEKVKEIKMKKQRLETNEALEDKEEEIMTEEVEEMDRTGIVVYTKKNKIYYCYGKLKVIYKRLIKLKYKVMKIKLNSKGFSIVMYAYILNKYHLDIGEKNFAINEFVKTKEEIKEECKKISKVKLLFSKNKFVAKIGKDDLLKEEIPINNSIKIWIEINGEQVPYKIGIRNKKIKKKQYYYAPIKYTYIQEFSFHIRRTSEGNLVLVKRKKEPVESKIGYRMMESKLVSIILYKMGGLYKFIRRKKTNLYFEKYAEKIEEGTYELFSLAKGRKTSKNYYVLDKTVKDYEKIEQNKNIIKKYSLKYYWLLYTSNTFITTEAPMHINILRSNNKYLRKAIYDKKFIFLQHGITYLKAHEKNSAYLRGKEATPTYMIAGSEKEKDVLFDMLKIKEEQVLMTGLPIFSTIKYKHITKASNDIVTIMLTWKPYEEHLYDFEMSSYYQNIITIYHIISKYIEKEKIIIVPHPKVYDLLINTKISENIWTGSISEILEKTKMLITDYSSICYNSFYQGSGVIFYQSDLNLYEKKNGELIPSDNEYIGKRAFNQEELENIIKETIKDRRIDLNAIRNKKFEDNYKTINEFSDGNNVERIYTELVNLSII